MKGLYGLLFPIFSFSISPFFRTKAGKSETSPLKFYGTICPIAQARREWAWLPFPVRVTAAGLQKTEAPLSSFQNIVCSCPSGMPHILRLLPRAKNRAQVIHPVQPRSFFFKVAPFQKKMGHFVCIPFWTKNWSSPPNGELLEGKDCV